MRWQQKYKAIFQKILLSWLLPYHFEISDLFLLNKKAYSHQQRPQNIFNFVWFRNLEIHSLQIHIHILIMQVKIKQNRNKVVFLTVCKNRMRLKHVFFLLCLNEKILFAFINSIFLLLSLVFFLLIRLRKKSRSTIFNSNKASQKQQKAFCFYSIKNWFDFFFV